MLFKCVYMCFKYLIIINVLVEEIFYFLNWIKRIDLILKY